MHLCVQHVCMQAYITHMTELCMIMHDCVKVYVFVHVCLHA
jgi:hypothetical protein